MSSAVVRWAMLFGAAAIVFGVTVAVGLKLVPSPHTETDYLVVGSVATFFSLVVLFAVLITTWIRSAEVFYKKRRKGEDGESAASEGEPPSQGQSPLS